jgi:hypothetical protein
VSSQNLRWLISVGALADFSLADLCFAKFVSKFVCKVCFARTSLEILG